MTRINWEGLVLNQVSCYIKKMLQIVIFTSNVITSNVPGDRTKVKLPKQLHVCMYTVTAPAIWQFHIASFVGTQWKHRIINHVSHKSFTNRQECQKDQKN